LILDELEELGFREIGRSQRDSWGWSHEFTPRMELKKNFSKLADEKSGKNTPKITKYKNDPYNLETRFTQKDYLY
jgi:hypothetical protein